MNLRRRIANLLGKPEKSAIARGLTPRGLTLVELMISIAVLGVASIGLSTLFAAMTESNLTQNSSQTLEAYATSILSSLRLDMQDAQTVTITNANTLSIVKNDTQSVVYQFTPSVGGFQIVRAGRVKAYNQFEFLCNDASKLPQFVGTYEDNNTRLTQVTLNNFCIREKKPISAYDRKYNSRNVVYYTNMAFSVNSGLVIN